MHLFIEKEGISSILAQLKNIQIENKSIMTKFKKKKNDIIDH